MASSVTPGPVRPAALTGWRLLLTRPALMPYNRLVVLVLALNAVVAGIIATTSASMSSDDAATLLITMSGVNLTAAVLIRQQYVINLLFRLATSVPKSAPLAVRRRLAKVYHFGGIHVGAAVAAVGWFLGEPPPSSSAIPSPCSRRAWPSPSSRAWSESSYRRCPRSANAAMTCSR